MSQVTLPEKLKSLLAGGLTYKAVAERAQCDTSTIFRIRNGDIANPSYSVGTAIDALYEERQKPAVA